jgi:hypothetical protein
LTFWFLILLGLAWVAVFLPAMLRAREVAPLSATQRFKRRMDLIAPSPTARAGRWVVVPSSTETLRNRHFLRLQRRRRRILEFLSIGSALSLLAALGFGGSLWELATAFVVSLSLYVGLLIGTKRQRIESAAKVRTLGARSAAEDEVVFHEPVSASGGSGH